MFQRLEDYILVFENVLTDELSDKILSEYANDTNWLKMATGSGVDANVRRGSVINISEKCIVDVNPALRKDLDTELFNCAGAAIAKYREVFPLTKIQHDSGYNLLRYVPGDFYMEHTDSFYTAPRTVSCSFALNDDYEGGEWGFFGRRITIRAPKNSAVMFPSNFMYPHEIMPVVSGTRYSIVTWFL